MALIFPTPLLVVNTFAVLLGQAPGNAQLVEHQSYVTALGADGYKAALDNLFKGVPTAQLAAAMRLNLGLTNIFTQADCEAFLDANKDNRVGAMLLLADILYNLVTTEPNLLAIQTPYVNSINASFEYSVIAANSTSKSLSSLVVTSQSFTLKAEADNLIGTSGDDTFSAIFSSTSTSSNTLSGGDAIDGAGGTGDKLTIRVIDTASGGSSVAPQSSNVEKFYITNLFATTTNRFFALDFASITGESEVGSKGSAAGSQTRALRVDSLAASIDTAEGGFSVNFKGTRTAATDAFSLSLNGAGTASGPAVFTTITTTGAVDSSFDIANLASTGAASVLKLGTAGLNLKTVNVTGDAALTLTEHTGFTGLSTIDASGMTGGGVNVDATSSTESGFVFKGSSAVDRVLLANTTINSATTLSAGDGKDTLASTSFNLTASVVNGSTGFEVLESVSPPSGGSLVANSFTTINEFLFSGGAGNSRVEISGVETSDRFVFASDLNHSTGAIRFTGASIGQTVVLELRASSEDNGEAAIQTSNTSEDARSAIAFDRITSVRIDSTGQNSHANLIEAVKTNGGGGDYSAFGNGSSFSNFVITGSQSLTIGAQAGVELGGGNTRNVGFSGAASVDASAFTGVLRVAGSRSDDAISGGSGDDIIYGLGGADTLTGNGGADQFRILGSSGTDLIKDFLSGSDKIGFNNVNFGATTATAAGANLAATDYIDNRSAITAIGASDDNKVVELQGALSAGQITSDAGAAVQAIVLVFNSTTGKGELWFDDDWSSAGSRSQLATFDNVTTLVGVTAFKNTDFVEFVS